MRFPLHFFLCLAAFLLASSRLPAAQQPESKGNVVLVHGIWHNHKSFNKMVRILQKDGYDCYAPDLSPNDCRHGIRELSRQLSAGIDARFGPKAPIVMVGFSMGGIITRDYVENVVPDRRRVRGVFLIASAGKGTLLANLSPNAGQRDMAVGSPFLRALNANSAAWKTIPIHAYWTPLDCIVLPSVNARWPENRSTRVICVLHPLMTWDGRVIGDIKKRMSAL